MIRLRWPVIILTVLVIAGASMGALGVCRFISIRPH